MRLVADVGGTNSRLAFSQGGQLVAGSIASFSNADWGSLYAVIEAYLSERDGAPSEIVAAVAGPVNGSSALLTNRNWTIKTKVLREKFTFQRASLMNDLTALGYAVPALRADQVTRLCDGVAAQDDVAQSLVVGLGTGFNVSPVARGPGGVLCPAVEAGHVSLPTRVAAAMAKAGVDPQNFETVEDLFSGRGLTDFVAGFADLPDLDGRAAVAAYGQSDMKKATQGIDLYSAFLGLLLRDLALSYMPTSGIYLAGSVARAVARCSIAPCLEAFQRPGKIAKANRVPIWTIDDDGAALLGCAGYA